MITTDRAGNTLNRGALDRQFARRVIDARMSFRLVDMKGDPTHSANWSYEQLPREAFESIGRSRSTPRRSDTLTLTVIPGALPPALKIKQGHYLALDRVIGPTPPNEWPYFFGRVKRVARRWVDVDGVTVQRIVVEVLGRLSVADDVWLDRLGTEPPTVISWATGSYLTGICAKRRFRVATVVDAGGSEKVPSPITYDVANQIRIAQDSAFSTVYSRGVDYTISTAAIPATITWAGDIDPVEPRWVEIPVPERFGIPRNALGFTYPQFLVLPYGREPDDLYHTTLAASGYNSGAKTITVKDPTPFKSGHGLLDTAQGEWVTVVQLTTGEEITRQLANPGGADVAGVLTHAGAAITFADGAGPVEGDLVRLSTTELYPIWTAHQKCTFFKDSLLSPAQAHKKGAFTFLTQAGMVAPHMPYNFTGGTSDSVYIGTSSLQVASMTSTSNWAPYYIANSLIADSTLRMFAAADVDGQWDGSWIRNVYRSDMSLGAFLTELKDKALTPSCYLHDTPAGKITVKPYRQKTTADWTLHLTTSLEEDAVDEQMTAAVVMSRDDEAREDNKAAVWLHEPLCVNVTNVGYVVDGSKQQPATRTSSSPTKITVAFWIPKVTPAEAYPNIREVRITGRGYATIYCLPDPDKLSSPSLAEVHNGDLRRKAVGVTDGTNQAPETWTIGGDELITLFNQNYANVLYVEMDEDDSGSVAVAPTITEIEIIAQNLVAWRAALTDDDAADGTYGAAPSGWVPTDTEAYGSIWWQPNMRARESYRFAPTSLLKRILPIYDTTGTAPAAKSRAKQKHRTATIQLSGISQQDARDIAERYLDEYVRTSREYRASAPLYDAADLGDTVRIYAPPGETFEDGTTTKLLMLWGIDDDGENATYNFVDYS